MKVKNKIKILEDGTIEMQLTQGKVALMDAEDYDLVKGHRWCAHKGEKTYYAQTNLKKDLGGYKTTSMHNLIMSPPEGMQADHENHNGLDNRRKLNLRLCTDRQNKMNRRPFKGSTSIYSGVSLFKQNGKWVSKINIDFKVKHIGYFHSEIEAALSYDKLARKHFKKYAYLNFTKGKENGLFKHSDLLKMKEAEKKNK